MEPPTACSLDPGAARSQLGEWRQVLGRAAVRAERVSPNRLEVTLSAGSEIGSVIDMARRETACCRFFRFTVEISVERLALTVEVPDDAAEALDHLV